MTSLLQYTPISTTYSYDEADVTEPGHGGLDSSDILIIILAVVFGSLAIFCIATYAMELYNAATNPSVLPVVSPGLPRSKVVSFSTVCFPDFNSLQIGKPTLDCPICLAEFTDDSTLRLLPNCNHAFHPLCIDAWLATKRTCPVCRSDIAGNLPRAPSGRIGYRAGEGTSLGIV